MKKIDVSVLSELLEEHALEELRQNRIRIKEILIHQNGEEVYHRVFGASPENGKTNGKPMLFRAASMTKPITSAAVAQLADAGLLDLKSPACRYFPKMERMNVAEIKNGKITSLHPAQNTILIEDLLCHTSGIGSAPVDAVLSSTAKMPHKEAVEAITGNPLSFDPRTSQAYSATDAFDVAAGIVEMISDMPFDEYLKKNIFDPLEMKDTTFAPSSEQWSRMVPMHNRTKDGENQEVPMPEGCVFADFIPERMMAGGGLAVTAQDYIRFADMLCFEGVGKNGKRVLSSKAVRNMATPHVPDEIYMGHERWGLGMRVIISPDYAQGLHVGCFGWSGAYGTHFWVDPENKVCAVMMKNSLFDGGAGNSSACSLERDVSASMDGGRRD